MGALPLALTLALLLPTDEPTAYQNPDLGLSLLVPAGWVVRDGDPEGQAQLVLGPPEGDAMLRFSVRVSPASASSDPRLLRDQLVNNLGGRSDLSDLDEVELTIAGRPAPGIGVTITVGDKVLRIEQYLLIENGQLYVLEARAPESDFRAQTQHFSVLREGFRFLALSDDQVAERRLAEIASRCGSEVGFADTWKEAAKRARAERKLILVRAMMLDGFSMTDADMVVGFMNPDVVELVQERYVPLSLRKGMPSPLADPEHYGIGPLGFGRGLLLVTPEGRVVQDGVGDLYEFLLDGLERDSEFPGPPTPYASDPLDQAQIHLRRGELARAEALLKEPTSARGHLLAASLHRRRRQGSLALASLEAARSAPGGDEFAGDITLDEAWVLSSLARNAEARDLADAFLEMHPEHPRTIEARFLLGLSLGALVGPSAATGVWDEFVTEHPESRWAWQAAGLLSSTAFGAAGKFKTGWLTDEVLEAQKQKPFEPLPTDEASLAERQAVEWLVAHQRSDGSWISPAEKSNVASAEPNEFTLAITAICGQALLGHGADEHADAVEQALEAVISIHDLFRSRVPVRYFMDYGVWSRAYLLGFLVECTEAGVREHDELGDRIATVIEELQEMQKPDGGWSYYVTGDLDSSTSAPLPSMTFTTAAVLLPLLRAHESDHAVPEQMIERGLDLLEAARNENGTFEYMLSPGMARGAIVAGAAGRGPVCTLALLYGGRAEVEDLRTALELFARHRDTYTRERGKSLMHCGSEGQGSHYLTFDYAYAAEAVRLLPSGERGRYRTAVLESVLSGRSEDGSYLDNPLVGWALGTGFAIWAFRDLGGLQ